MRSITDFKSLKTWQLRIPCQHINDIYFNESLVSITHVREHLSTYGLCKDPERLENETKVLGLQVL